MARTRRTQPDRGGAARATAWPHAAHRALILLTAAAALPGQAAPDDWPEHLREIQALKREAHYGEALVKIEAAMQQGGGTGVRAAALCYEAAECHRLAFDWDAAHHWLDRAERAVAGPADAADGEAVAHARTMNTIGRGLVQLAQGMPEAAREAVLQARPRLRTGDRETAFALARLELRVLRFLDLPRAARRTLADYESAFGPEPTLRCMAATAILQDPTTATAERAEVGAWLDDAAGAGRTADALAALTLRIVQLLDDGDFATAASRLAEARERVASFDNGERRLAIDVLALRHAHDAGLPASATRDCHARLLATWNERQQLHGRQPLSRTGLAARFDLERQRGLGELMRTHLRLDGEQGPRLALQHLLDSEQLGTMARTVAAPASDVAAVQRSLTGDDRGLLVYVPGPERTFVFTVDAQRVQARELPLPVLRAQRLARELVRAIRDAHDPQPALLAARAAAEAELAACLLPPSVADAMAPWTSVSIVGLDGLGFVPFEWLRLPSGDRLGLAKAVAYLPSLVVGRWLHERRAARPAPGPQPFALVACPDARSPDARVSPLPFGAGELTPLTASLDGQPANLLTSADVTLPALRKTLTGTAYAALVMHGRRDDRRADPQGLLLGDGATLWSPDFEQLPLPRLLFLGACQSGDGPQRLGDDGRHLLTGGAMLAGCDAIFAPWLDVDYRATLALLQAFDEALVGDGLDAAEALRRARRKVTGADGSGPIDAFLFHLHGLADARLPTANAANAKR